VRVSLSRSLSLAVTPFSESPFFSLSLSRIMRVA